MTIKKINIKYIALFFVMLFAMMITIQSAHAVDVLSLSVADSDKSMQKFLKPMFGELFDGSASPIQQVVATFNSVILFIGGILFLYTVVFGTMATAHDGEALGKRWSSMWVPIRTAVGTAMLVPLSSGYCGVQYLIAWLVTQGIALANIVWASYIDAYLSFTNGSANSLSAVGLSSIPGNTGTDILKVLSCYQLKKVIHSQTPSVTQDGIMSRNVDNASEFVRAYGGNGYIYDDTECGTIEATNDLKEVLSNSASFHSSSLSFAADNPGTSIAQFTTLSNNYFTAKKTALKNYITKLDTLATKLANDQDVTTAEFTAAKNAYLADVKNANNIIQSYANNALNDFKTNAKTNAAQDGWLLAGAWYMKIISIQDDIKKIVAVGVPKVSTYVVTEKPEDYNDFHKKYVEITKKISVVSSGDYGFSQQNYNKTDSGFMERMLQEAFAGDDFLSGNVSSTLKNTNIVLVTKYFGDKMLNWSAGLSGILALVAVGGAFIPVLSSASSVLMSALSPLFTNIITMLGAGGAMLSFWLPMLPFMIWLGAFIGWLVVVVEAVFGAPLWAVIHLHPNAEGFEGKGSSGYTLVLGLALRPSLMILGLGASMLILEPLSVFYNEIFFTVFKTSTDSAGTIHGFFSTFFGLVMYGVIAASLVKKCFNLITFIPDQIMKWIGGPGEQLGQHAGEINQDASGRVAGAMGAGTGAVANSMSGAGRGVGEAMNHQRQAKQNDKNQANDNMNSALSNLSNIQNTPSENFGGEEKKNSALQSAAESVRSNANTLGKLSGILDKNGNTKDESKFTQSQQGIANNINHAVERANQASIGNTAKDDTNENNKFK